MKRWLFLAAGVIWAAGCQVPDSRPLGFETKGKKATAADKAGPLSESDPVVLIDTSMGPIKVELFQDKAPITVKNFLDYTDDKFFDGTIFHRVIKDFMI